MIRRQYLQVPGPTNIPERILRSLSQPLINHRGPEFERLFTENTEGLKKVFRTSNDILLFPSSGSGMLESVVVNLFSPGDTVLVGSMGLFGERMAVIAENHQVNVIRITKEWGQAVTVDDVRNVLEKDREKKIKAVCLPHNETSTGITHHIESIARMIRELGHPAVLALDAISSLACTPLETDGWGIDVVVSATQKGLMLPPGLGFVSVSPKAWELRDRSTMPKWYWDYKAVREKNKVFQFPYTPPTTLFFGLRESLTILLNEEGLENVWKRHALIASAVRNAITAMGLHLFAEKGYESDTVTAISMPEGITYKALAELLRTQYQVVIGGGLQKLQGKIFRIGHMGAIHVPEILAIMGSVEMALVQCGYNVKPGTAARAVAETCLSSASNHTGQKS
jgi:aspartate aminotransferase-like enzyme